MAFQFRNESLNSRREKDHCEQNALIKRFDFGDLRSVCDSTFRPFANHSLFSRIPLQAARRLPARSDSIAVRTTTTKHLHRDFVYRELTYRGFFASWQVHFAVRAIVRSGF